MYTIYLKDTDGRALTEDYRTRTEAVEAAAYLAARGYQVRAIRFFHWQ